MGVREDLKAKIHRLSDEIAEAEDELKYLRGRRDEAEAELAELVDKDLTAADELHAARADPRQIGLPL